MLWLKKEVSVGGKEDQLYVDYDTNEEEIDDFNLYHEMECHWRIVFKHNDAGVDDTK